MKKKITIGLGATVAIATPVFGLMSCVNSCENKEPLVEKFISLFPDKIEVKDANHDFDILKSFTTDGKELNQNEFKTIEKGITNLDSDFMNKKNKIEAEEKDFMSKYHPSDNSVPKANIKSTIKTVKGFTNNKITIEIQFVTEETQPKKIYRGIATKNIEIIFLKKTLSDKLISLFPNQIKVKGANNGFDLLKSFTSDGKELNQKEFKKIVKAIANFDNNFMNNKNKIEAEEKEFMSKYHPSDNSDPKANIKSTIKIVKGFTNNKITIEIKFTTEETQPKKIDRSAATKNIEIIFAKKTFADKIISIFPDKIEVETDNNSFNILKNLKTDGEVLKEKETDVIFNKYFGIEKNIKKLAKLLEDEKIAFDKMLWTKSIKIVKGFKDNKITIEIKFTIEETQPKKINKSTAAKTIEITFAYY